MKIFNDERVLWYTELNSISKELEHKSHREILKILNNYDIVRLKLSKPMKRPKYQRVVCLILVPILLVICTIKWTLGFSFSLNRLAIRYPNTFGRMVDMMDETL